MSPTLHKDMLKEARLKKGAKSTKYEEVGKHPSLKEILIKKAYIRFYKFIYEEMIYNL